jgi:hypothetical protein
MPDGVCHAKGCNMLMKDHTGQDHLKCSIILAEEIRKKHEAKARARVNSVKGVCDHNIPVDEECTACLAKSDLLLEWD